MDLKIFFAAWKGMRAFNALPEKAREIVFYAEDYGSWVFFAPIISALQAQGKTICYLTSSPADPILSQASAQLNPFFIGEGMFRTIIFKVLKAQVMVMTMPDLETYYIKRSTNPVHYIYVYHALVSTHMVYTPTAFDAFDTIFCVGQHHVDEIRKREQLQGLPAKKLVHHGYARLDSIINNSRRNTSTRKNPPTRKDDDKIKVLLAPSWGPHGIFETALARELITTLLAAGFLVTARPHPMTKKRCPKQLQAIKSEFSTKADFFYDDNIASEESLHAADVMIGDWSGAALEYTFGREKPVVFIDIPRKVNNSNYDKLGIEPLEVFIREKVGRVVAPAQLAELPLIIYDLVDSQTQVQATIQAYRNQYIFNVGSSGQAGARYILDFLAAGSNS